MMRPMSTCRSTLIFALCGALSCETAAADGIEIRGTAQMGLVGSSTAMGDHRTRLLHDLDLTLRLTRTTDGGLTFGLQVDLDDLLNGTSTPPRHRDRPVEE